MKKLRFLLVFILANIVFFSACVRGNSAPILLTSTTIPTQTQNTSPPIQPNASPTPEVFTERFGVVWVPAINDFAGYVYRSFLQIPVGMKWGPDGYLYIADWAGRHVVRIKKDGTMDDLPFWKTVMALQTDGPRDVEFDSKGNLFTHNHGKIFRVDKDGNVIELGGIQGSPIGSIAISAADELYYTDRGEQGALRKWNPAGYSETIVANLPFAENMLFGLNGTLYLTQMGQANVLKIDLKNGSTTIFKEGVCEFDPCFLAIDPEGDIWVRAIFHLRQFTPEGIEKEFKVDGEIYPNGPYNWHSSAGIAFDDEGGLWVASYNSRLMRLVPLSTGQSDPDFKMQIISTGFEATDLDVNINGEIYAPDMNSQQLVKFNPNGQSEVLAQNIGYGRIAVAVDQIGFVYLGLSNGKIVRVEADGSFSDYAALMTKRMKFGTDGALYAIVGNEGQSKTIVKITDKDKYTTFATQIDGIPLGNGEIHISPVQDKGFYVFTENERNLFFIDYKAQGHLVTNLQTLGGGSGPAVMAASPVLDELYIIPHGPYSVFHINADGKSEEIASRVYGDPWGMVVSDDGNWLYVAESGVIDKIPISSNR